MNLQNVNIPQALIAVACFLAALALLPGLARDIIKAIRSRRDAQPDTTEEENE